jgi:ribose 5-phosphate isomerase B
VWSLDTAKLAREHNDANVISIGGRMHDEEFCLKLVDTFLATPFSGDERHVRRIGLIADYETGGKVKP